MNTESKKHVLADVTENEKLLSMISHLSIILGTGGLVIAVVIWATQTGKSKFVRFNSLQAIFFHLSLIAVILLMVVMMIFLIIILGIGEGIFKHHYLHSQQMPIPIIIVCAVFTLAIIFVAVAAVIYEVYLAVKSNEGYLIKIPVIGNMIRNE